MGKDLDQTIADAQAFIDSMNNFNGVKEIKSDSSSIRDSRSDPPRSLDSSFSSNLIKFTPKSQYDNPFRADVLTFVEVYYYENKRLPETHVLHEHFKDHSERPSFLKGWKSVLDEISESLSNRGIKPYNTVENYIDPKFAWAVSLIVNHLDKRTIPAKLKEAGFRTKDWQAFLSRKRHYEYFQSRS